MLYISNYEKPKIQKELRRPKVEEDRSIISAAPL